MTQQVLVVQEKHTAPAFKCVWKLPTGFITEVYALCLFFIPIKQISLKSWHLTVLITANQAEEIYNGVVREVKEETGVRNICLEICKLIYLYSQKKKHLAFCDENSAGVVHSWHTKGYYSIDTADWYRLCGSYCF